jgi:glycosyltransferase involved in cell wall biosynthesis
MLLSPDPGILWAWRASRNPLVLEHGAGAALVLSSSFPESAHVAAARLATLLGARLAVDLRDGWLDEPMKPLLRRSLLRRRREGLLERRILRQAGTIFVTSQQWRHLLSQRLPFTADKIVTLTNAYPLECRSEAAVMNRPQQPFTLLYAGRLSTSRAERRIEHLLQPLLTGLQAIDQGGRLLFVGNLGQSELDALQSWRDVFMRAGWDLAVRAAVPRSSALELMRNAHGLLLLSSSHASIPAKLFDYLCARRPILALAPPSSAVAELAAQLPQLLVLDYRDAGAAKSTVDKFIRVCGDMPSYDLPPQFGEAHLRTVFLTALEYLEKEAP